MDDQAGREAIDVALSLLADQGFDATSMAQMEQLLFNDRIDAALCALFAFVVVAVAAFGLRAALQAGGLSTPQEARA